MNRRHTRDRARTAALICQAAARYKENLVGRKFLYLFDRRFIEVIYTAKNFRHLTGVDTYLSANEFYRLAVRGHLTGNQIFFSASHPYTLCQRKLIHLSDISNLCTSESFMLEEITTHTSMFRFGTTDLHFTLCFNQQLDNSGRPLNEVFHVESLRDEDCFTKSESVYTVDAILYKQNTAKQYDHLAYLDHPLIPADLPSPLRSLCSEQLLSELHILH